MMKSLGLVVGPAMFPFASSMSEQQVGLPRRFHERDWKGDEGKRSRRGLQTSCTEGDPFTITSSALPSLEGCMIHSGSVSADVHLDYNSSSAAVVSMPLPSTTTTDGSADAFWLVLEIIDDGVFETRCASLENSTALSHPVEATWICDVDGDGELEFPTSSQFSTSCGCSTTTVSTADIGTETTIESGSAACDEGESFAIVSTLLPEVAGCYTDTGIEIENEVFYTETGTADPGQNIVQALDAGVDNASDVRWAAGYYASSDTTSIEDELYCYSSDQAADVHPADVTFWFCIMGTTGEGELVSSEAFSTSCGCLSTSTTQVTSSTSKASTIEPSSSPFESTSTPGTPVTTPSAMPVFPISASPLLVGITLAPSAASRGMVPSGSPASASSMSTTESMTLTDTSATPASVTSETPPPSPVPGSPSSTPSPSDTCDGEFWVTSSAAPVLEGCFQAIAIGTVTSTFNGETVYSNAADNSDEDTVTITVGDNDNFDPSLFWVVAVGGLDSTTADNVYYCISTERADEVHPADATWSCDLSGATIAAADFVEVSDTDLAVTCGCLEMTPSPSSIPGNEQDVDIGHLSTTLSTFVAVGVGFAAAAVHLVGL